jgi:hypothetical protein
MRFTREATHIMRASPLMRFLGKADSPSEQTTTNRPTGLAEISATPEQEFAAEHSQVVTILAIPSQEPQPTTDQPQPAQSPPKRRRGGGRPQEFYRDPLWQLAEQQPGSDKDLYRYLERNPDWVDKNLRCYPVKDKSKSPSLRWVQRCMQDYRDRTRQN